ncbi:hypothetical protein N0V82_004158 [Gnomoniopsis sp. IMI 355080]|nr:hypothetical protein N0V82_004158 [Gnomoniopsis sp. IMI 355080]
MSTSSAPGRLGDPTTSLATDPRLHPKLLVTLQNYGLDQNQPATELTPESPFDAIRELLAKDDEEGRAFYNLVVFPEEEETTTSAIKITAIDKLIPRPDSTELRLTIRRQQGTDATDPKYVKVPAIVHIHGGGMVVGSTDNPPNNKWAEALVRTGMVVITVHFRNAYDKDGDNPFPAGLNDCATAARWVHEHRAELGISKVLLQGESGGGNLSLATALKANKEGWIQAIDGVAAYIPFIGGPAYGMPTEWKRRELPSLVENDGYFINVATCALYTKMYDPDDKHHRNPLAFPYWAQEEDLRGLPPHLIVTSELDPFRDEGNAYYRKLVRAGVTAVGKTTLGVIHGTELAWGAISGAPEFRENSIWEIKKFAEST